MHRFLLAVVVLCTTLAAEAQPVALASLPDAFKRSIPPSLSGDLTLVELQNRCNDCEPWRYIDFYGNASHAPIKKERVSVVAGYRAMYAYPGTQYFSNTKIEQSAPGQFDADRRIMEEAIQHEFQRKKERVEAYLGSNPQTKDRLESKRLKGRDYIEFERAERNGIQYASYVENAIGLTGATISQVHFFVPSTRITVTAYLLKQERASFANIEEFRKLREQFIDSYTAFLAAWQGE